MNRRKVIKAAFGLAAAVGTMAPQVAWPYEVKKTLLYVLQKATWLACAEWDDSDGEHWGRYEYMTFSDEIERQLHAKEIVEYNGFTVIYGETFKFAKIGGALA